MGPNVLEGTLCVPPPWLWSINPLSAQAAGRRLGCSIGCSAFDINILSFLQSLAVKLAKNRKRNLYTILSNLVFLSYKHRNQAALLNFFLIKELVTADIK
jgi:hypothetical protein